MTYPSENIKAISEFIFIGQPAEQLVPADLVIVLGNHIIELMMGEVAELYAGGKIKKDAVIVLTGATGDMTAGQAAECDQMYEAATVTYGMPGELFLKENRATNTYLNLLYSKELLEKRNPEGLESVQKILCVGNSFLLRRASLYAAKLGFPAEKMQYFGVWDKKGRNIGPHSWWESDVSVQRVMAEIERIGKYYATGNMSIF
ncbi:MAG: YdcF family protein [Lachnospiraceae bacterium]|nr:YdcF family protein [Lachnospiraceae bacterium]